MSETVYDVDYFLRKFEAIPDEKWATGSMGHDGKGCALFHCDGVYGQWDQHSTETKALMRLFGATEGDNDAEKFVYQINDNGRPVGENKVYQQPTPKARILAALADIKAKQKANL